MIPIKIQCDCGQRYAFDIEPVNNRMPMPVACPVCGADGTPAANEIIARSLPAAPATPAAAPAGVRLSMPVPSAAPAPASAPADAPFAAAATRFASPGSRAESEGEKWKWWYFVLAGVCIGGYSIWQAYDQHRLKPLGELFLAVFCIAIGIWDFQHKRKRKRIQG
ncbi:MAG TPA: hypothetical protein VN578_13320 [Candidatus Binatia bacterium]|nr:hypothetical protein [Candidatus Binatia bacterium]